MKLDSIRWRLIISYVSLTLLAVFLVGMLTLTLLEGYVKAQTESQLTANARTIASQAAMLMQPEPQLADLRELVQSVSFLGRMRVRIMDDQNNIMIDSGPAGDYTSVLWVQPQPEELNQPTFLVKIARSLEEQFNQEKWLRENATHLPSIVVQVEEGPWGREVVFQTSSGKEAFLPPITNSQSAQTNSGEPQSWANVHIPIGDENNPLGYVQLDSYSGVGQEILAAMRWALLLSGLFAAAIAVVAGLLVSRNLSAPLQALAESATRMSNGDLAARAPSGGLGEIGQLSQQFNHMAEGLQASFNTLSTERDTLRRFIADASHELRTPITALHSFIDLLQGPAARDPAAREEFLSESQSQIQRMEWITNNLLDLSRLDAGLVELDLHDTNLNELLQSVCAPFIPVAQEKGISLEVQVPDEKVQVTCDRARMEIVMSNLLDNALKFTSPGGKINVRGGQVNERVCIQVQDSGSGIPEEDLPHIFERFYRGKTSVRGSGLGLAIVHSIIQAHGGGVTVKSQPGQGSCFTIML